MLVAAFNQMRFVTFLCMCRSSLLNFRLLKDKNEKCLHYTLVRAASKFLHVKHLFLSICSMLMSVLSNSPDNENWCCPCFTSSAKHTHTHSHCTTVNRPVWLSVGCCHTPHTPGWDVAFRWSLTFRLPSPRHNDTHRRTWNTWPRTCVRAWRRSVHWRQLSAHPVLCL